MAAPSTQRPAALPPQPQQPKVAVPQGAARLAKTWLDDKNIPHTSVKAVPVDDSEHRTAHVWMQCTHESPINGGGKERCRTAEWRLPDAKPKFCSEHGDKLEEVKETAGPSKLAHLISETRSMYGRAALPWAIPAAGLAADLGMTAGGVNALEAGFAVPVLAGVTWWGAKKWLVRDAAAKGAIIAGQKTGRRLTQIQRRARRHAITAAEIGGWGVALAATDIATWPGRIVAAAGMVRWALGMVPWWDRAENRRLRAAERAVLPTVDVQQATAQSAEAPDPVKLRAITAWVTLIGCAGGPLAGTELQEVERLPACKVGVASRTMVPNWRAKVVAKVDGSINMRENRPNLRGRIAAAYKCTYADVSFYADEDDLSVGWVRVQPDNPLAEVRMWTGLEATDWKRGVSQVGRFDDGMPIKYQWADAGGACHDLIGGCSGSGKSELVAQLLLISLHSDGLVLDWVGDPQRGQSFGALKDEVDWFAGGKAEIKLMLIAAVKEMFRRNDVLSRKNIKTWTFAVARQLDMPLLVITLDEIQNYIDDPDILELVTTLAGMARKCGIKMRLLTQIIAAYNLGGDTYIKEQVKTGQTIVFRSETDVAGRSSIEGDSLIDPTQLPGKWGKNTCAAGEKTAGLSFFQGVHGRDVYGRTDWTGDDMEVWLKDRNGDPSVCPGRFSPEAQQESGVLWGDRRERARRLLEAGRDDADILKGGRAVELIEAAAAFARGETATPAPVAHTPAAPAGQAKGGAREKVAAAAREVADLAGIAAKKDIVAALQGQVAETTVTSMLTELIGSRDLVRVKNGQYLIPGLADENRRAAEAEVPA